jgi:predicted CoA-binding protein
MEKLLLQAHTIAVVGLSNDINKPSYGVALYLQNHGYRIIPVNPNIDAWFGEKSYPSITAIPQSIHLDIIDIFRKSEYIPSIVEEVILRNEHPIIWMQEGIISKEAKQKASTHGFPVVMDACIMKEHQKLIAS